MKRLVRVASVALVLALLTAVAVGAEQAEGTGSLRAIGAGVARVEGDGTVDIRGLGVGTIWVRNAQHLTAAGRGIRWDLPGGDVYFVGWSGHVEASGEGLVVNMMGSLIEFKANGSGTVFLRGRGRYWKQGQEGLWSRDGITVPLDAVV